MNNKENQWTNCSVWTRRERKICFFEFEEDKGIATLQPQFLFEHFLINNSYLTLCALQRSFSKEKILSWLVLFNLALGFEFGLPTHKLFLVCFKLLDLCTNLPLLKTFFTDGVETSVICFNSFNDEVFVPFTAFLLILGNYSLFGDRTKDI